jgi:AraC-type transcriptional regulator N-terminus
MSEETTMDVPDRPASGSEARGVGAGRDELAERVARAVGEDGTVEAPGGLRLLRQSSPTPKDHGVSSPAFCVIAQGSKEVLLGDDCYRYDANHYLVTAAALPTATRVTEASEERPYLGVVLGLDPALVGSVMVEASHPAPGNHAAVRAFDVGPLEAGLLDAVMRLQEARRLMLGENLDAGFRVGYGDASHFTREYKRLFGVPPMRDVEGLREAAT